MVKSDDSKVVKSPPSSGKKKKYVSLYAKEAESDNVILLPGRHKCDCQALKHKLINNCLECGRIVCQQEGSGPCSFCGNLVASKEEKEILERGSKKSETLHNKLKHTKKIDSKNKDGLEKAIEHKNKLLEYDKNSEKRTKVFDDQSDYFHSGSKWINPTNREKLEKMEKEFKDKKYDRSNKKVTVDLLGRQIVVQDDYTLNTNDPAFRQLIETDNNIFKDQFNPANTISIERPVFIEDNINEKQTRDSSVFSNIQKIQDKELKEMSDDGMCISMHQPWASLLVKGIKKHEGRVWYSSHRGRLWIASASRAPIPEEVEHVEDMYRNLYGNKDITFPKHYPTGCLLGCVDLKNVLPQEEYQIAYPNGESDSPYVFICENPIEMPVKFPMKGQHKIYKIDEKIHKAAKKALPI